MPLGLGSRTHKGSFTGGMSGSGGMSGAARGRRRGGGGRRGMRLPRASDIMPGIKLGITTKFRLNDPYWTKKIGRARANAMKAMGALLRTYARNSIRKRKTMHVTPYGIQYEPSPPNTPPYSHTNHRVASIKNIQYDYMPNIDSLYVGAVKFRTTYNTTVPSVHEHGKKVRVQKTITLPPAFGAPKASRTKSQRDAWRRMAMRNHPRYVAHRNSMRGKSMKRVKLPPKPIRFPDRPFMKPALTKSTNNGALARRFASAFHRSM